MFLFILIFIIPVLPQLLTIHDVAQVFLLFTVLYHVHSIVGPLTLLLGLPGPTHI